MEVQDKFHRGKILKNVLRKSEFSANICHKAEAEIEISAETFWAAGSWKPKSGGNIEYGVCTEILESKYFATL